MDLRRLLNTAYAAIVGGMETEDRVAFDQSLVGPPAPEVDHRGRRILARPAPSRGTDALRASLMGGGA